MRCALYLAEDNCIKHKSICDQMIPIKEYIRSQTGIKPENMKEYVDTADTYNSLEILIGDIACGNIDILIAYDSQCISHFDTDILNLKIALENSNTMYYEVATKCSLLVAHRYPVKSFYGTKKDYILTGHLENYFEEAKIQENKNINLPLILIRGSLKLLYCFLKMTIIMLFTVVKAAFSFILLFV